MAPELTHLSYSSINLYLTCARAWHFRYVEKVPTPVAPELVFGSAVHDAIEEHVRNGRPLLEAFAETWNTRIAAEPVCWGASTPEEHYNNGVRLLGDAKVQAGLAAIHAAHDSEGARIERRIELNLPGVPIPIIGYVDIVSDDGVPGDFKTSARSWTQDKAASELQSLFYLAAFNQLGIATPEWKFRHFILVKTKQPQLQILEHAHRPGEIFWMIELVQRAWLGIEREVYPMNPNSWKCSPQWCDHYGLCRGR